MSQYYDLVTALGPDLWFKFNETSGTPANSGSLTCTLSGSATLNATGVQSKSISLNGSSNGYTLSALTANSLFDDAVFSVEAWFKTPTMTSSSSDRTIFSITDNALSSILNLRVMGGSYYGKVDITFAPTTSGAAAVTTSGRYDDNAWHHVVATINNATDTVKLYVDGSLIGSTSSSAVTTWTVDASTSYRKSVGRISKPNGTYTTGYFNGNLDEIAVYDFVLSSTQVSDNYNAGINTNFVATPMTAAAQMPKVLAVHDLLYNLAVADGAAYVFKFDSSKTSAYAPSGHSFSDDNSNNISYDSHQAVTGTNGSWLVGADAYFGLNENATPVFDDLKGMTAEVVFYYNTFVEDNVPNALLYKGWSNGSDSFCLFLGKSSPTENVVIGRIDQNTNGTFNSGISPKIGWNHVVMQWGAQDDKITIWVNGEKTQSTATRSGNINHWNDNTNYQFAQANGIKLDFVAYYATTYNSQYLSDDDVVIHYAAVANAENDLTNPVIFAETMSASASMANPSESLGITAGPMAVIASGAMVQPNVILTMNSVDPMLGSAMMPLPQGLGVVTMFAETMNASATAVNPNVLAIDNELYYVNPMNASVEFVNPFWSHDSGLDASAMGAEAVLVEPVVDIAGRVRANAMVATAGTLVEPDFEAFENARIEAQTMYVSAVFAVPPAYKLLTDDIWYVKLYEQQATDFDPNLAKKGFMKLFEDVATDITIPNGEKLYSNVPDRIFTDDPTSTEDSYISILPSKGSGSGFSSSYGEGNIIYYTPSPVLETGYYDEHERKAVKFKNIEFQFPGENTFSSAGIYSLEFNIKTDKSNQIMFRGYQKYQDYAWVDSSSIGLKDGKIYGMTYRKTPTTLDVAVHPDAISIKDSLVQGYVVGRTNIADGNWHHVVVQSHDGAFQIWIDGVIDVQSKSNLGARIRPFIFGSNNKIEKYQSDFLTSLLSYDVEAFIPNGAAFEHYLASIKSEPIKVEPMVANATVTQENKATGSRSRALMLYFWPTRDNGYYYGANTGSYGPLQTINDQGKWGDFDEDTFDNNLSTMDYIASPPQQYYGWDVFPVDVNGYYVSDLVKPEAYGGADNIIVNSFSESVLTPQQAANTTNRFKMNKRGFFVDPVTDDKRYIDLLNDIDLSQFDAIFFRNYPDQPQELDNWAREDIVDEYFNIREKQIFKDFVDSLRAAVDTGISLMVTNHQLAMDLGIISGYEVVPDMDDLTDNKTQAWNGDSDPYTPTLLSSTHAVSGNAYFHDTYKNNRFRVVSTMTGLTDDDSFIWTDAAFYQSDDQVSYGEPDRPWNRYERRQNGLSVGDEFIISDFSPWGSTSYLAVPSSSVKAGTIITKFGANVRKSLESIPNPYRDYVTTIAVSPGDVLNGTQCGGKIFVDFTERMSKASSRFNSPSTDYSQVDLSRDYWINFAFDNELITEAQKATLLAGTLSAPNLDRSLENNLITQEEYNKLAFWSSSGDNVIYENDQIDPFSKGSAKGGIKQTVTKAHVVSITNTKTRRRPTVKTVYSDNQWFIFSYARRYITMQIEVFSMLTRGFRWLSERVSLSGEIQRPLAMNSSAIMVNPSVSADRVISVNAPAMLALAQLAGNGYSPDTRVATLPLQATAIMNGFQRLYRAAPMTASIRTGQNVRALTSSIDEVVLYIYHEDPILYLREEIIK